MIIRLDVLYIIYAFHIMFEESQLQVLQNHGVI